MIRQPKDQTWSRQRSLKARSGQTKQGAQPTGRARRGWSVTITRLASVVGLGLLFGLGSAAAGAQTPAATSFTAAGRIDEVAQRFRDPSEIRLSAQQVERPDAATFTWGRGVLAELGVAAMPPAGRAEAIVRYLHRTLAFTPDRPATIAAAVAAGGGNCYAHARVAAFLLRLAEVPARFVYDVHLEHKTPLASEQARERGIALFGHYHNDHFWLLFHDGSSWIPFDSSLGIANRAEFLRVKVDQPAGGVANPPFLVWRESADPTEPMENVTASFWAELGRSSLPGVSPADWQHLLDAFSGLAVDDLRRPIDPVREAVIARVARPFFGIAE